jgi:hypothetical protein
MSHHLNGSPASPEPWIEMRFSALGRASEGPSLICNFFLGSTLGGHARGQKLICLVTKSRKGAELQKIN